MHPDYARRFYVERPLFWEACEVPYHLRSEKHAIFAYLGFQIKAHGSYSHAWYVALSEHDHMDLKALYFVVLHRKRLVWVRKEIFRTQRRVGVG